ncbi:MAG: hypothetical protein J6L98_05900 [Bacteroidales bacterium]|nr:hypothetical protein [Bacteroidales bacterium]
MNSFRHIFIAFLCLLAASSVAQAQNDWDSVLDRYEKITLQCMSLRDKAAAGERVSQKSVTELFGELNRLRNSLQQASGKMTAKQRERFRRVRELYDGKMAGQDGALRLRSGTVESRSGTVENRSGTVESRSGTGENRSGTVGSTSGTGEKNTAEASSHQPVGERSRTAVGEQSRIPVGERSRTAGRIMVEPLPKVEGWPVGLEILRSAQNDNLSRNNIPVILNGDAGEVKDLPQAAGKVKDLPQAAGKVKDQQAETARTARATGTMTGKHLTFNAIPTLSIGDTRQGGLFLAMTRGQWGGYVSLRTNLKSQLYAYDILSDGTTGGEARFEAKGGQRLGEYSASAGVVRTVTPWMDLYAGAGFGSSTLCWNDIHGAWAKVRDYSAAGLLLDGGAVFHIGKFSLLGGVSYLTARPEAGPFMPVFTIGAGIRF